MTIVITITIIIIIIIIMSTYACVYVYVAGFRIAKLWNVPKSFPDVMRVKTLSLGLKPLEHASNVVESELHPFGHLMSYPSSQVRSPSVGNMSRYRP